MTETYEEECAHRTHGVIAGDPLFAHLGKVLRDVRVEGVFPDTRLVVRFYDHKRERERSQEFELREFGYGSEPDQRTTPAGVATIIAANVVAPG